MNNNDIIGYVLGGLFIFGIIIGLFLGSIITAGHYEDVISKLEPQTNMCIDR